MIGDDHPRMLFVQLVLNKCGESRFQVFQRFKVSETVADVIAELGRISSGPRSGCGYVDGGRALNGDEGNLLSNKWAP